MIRILFLWFVGLALAVPVDAAKPCAGMQLADGAVHLRQPLGASGQLQANEMECLDSIGKQLVARGGVRSVTVAARVKDAWRVDGTGQRMAAIAGARLGSAGIPATRITMIVPPAASEPQEGLHLTFTQSRAARAVGMVVGASGAVASGPSPDRLAPIQAGAKLGMGQRVATGPNATATLGLADGSRLRMEENTVVVLAQLTIGRDMTRTVVLELVAGEVTADVPKAAGSFQIKTSSGVAGGRGARFRLHHRADQPTRLETLVGKVNLGNSAGDVDVGMLLGSRIEAGTAPEAPRTLPVSPDVRRPMGGALSSGGQLAWAGVSGASGWRLALARDAEFLLDVGVVRGSGKTRHPPDLESGMWFWRVATVDVDGFTGPFSRVYAFNVSE